MLRHIFTWAVVFAAIVVAGCAQESLDVPVEGDLVESETASGDSAGDVENSEDANRDPVEPATDGGSAPEEPERPSAVRSIFNALKSGTAEALDQREEPQP